MDYLIQFQMSIFALSGLVLLFYTIYRRAQSFNYAKRLLLYIIVANIIGLISEAMSWIFDGELYYGVYFLEYASNFLLYLMTPILAGLIAAYIDFKIFYSKKRLMKLLYYQHTSVIVFILLCINIFYPFIFDVNPVTNAFVSKPLGWMSYAIVLCFYLYMIFVLLKYAQKTNRTTKKVFIISFLLPLVGMLIQMIESRLFVSWTAVTLRIYIIYTYIESSTGDYDYLTKLYTRYSYRVFIRQYIEEQISFGILFIDLNGFKKINDKYGHQIGDEVLIEFGIILQKVFHNEKMIARLGGDEFIVVIEQNHNQLDDCLKHIHDHINHSPLKVIHGLSFAYGYQLHEHQMNSDELFDEADKKMYEHKNK